MIVNQAPYPYRVLPLCLSAYTTSIAVIVFLFELSAKTAEYFNTFLKK